MNLKFQKRILLFGILLLLIITFYVWSRLLLLSLFLIFVLDSFTLEFSTKFIKEKLSVKMIASLKYSYLAILSISLAIFIRIFLFDIYFVPSSSMEKTLVPNDYVLVNKILYGVKMPKRIQEVPLIGSLFRSESTLTEYDLYKSLKSFRNYKREDVVVFKSIQDNKEFLIKRIIGMPGDTVIIADSKVLVNGKYLKDKEEYCYNYIDNSRDDGSNVIRHYSNKEYKKLGNNLKKTLKKDIKNEKSRKSFLFPINLSIEKHWSRDNYGKIIIPKKGMEITLNKYNFELYKDIIRKYEKERINVSESETYTFRNDYYFMMGDNRHNSRDSRHFGFVPESYIQGKMIYIF